MTTRCKFECVAVTKRFSNVWSVDGKSSGPGFIYEAEFFPVTGGTAEDRAFFASTPTGKLQIGTIRDDHFTPGKKYHIDFSEAE